MTAEPAQFGVRAETNDDLKLVEASKNGDVAAFEQLVKRYDGKLFRIALSVTHNREDSQDAVQDWDDDRAITILGNCRRAMTRNSRVLLVDMIVPDNGVNCFSKLLDLNMLVMNGGRECTETEFRTLLDASGYKLTKIVPTMAPQSVIEAVPT
jgi:hypothetical protein